MTPEDMQERDIVEFTDDNGNTLMLEVMDYFYYNGQEFAALCNANENPGDDDPDDDAVYIMQVNTFEDENGEEMEEFVPPEEALMEKPMTKTRTNKRRSMRGVKHRFAPFFLFPSHCPLIFFLACDKIKARRRALVWISRAYRSDHDGGHGRSFSFAGLPAFHEAQMRRYMRRRSLAEGSAWLSPPFG